MINPVNLFIKKLSKKNCNPENFHIAWNENNKTGKYSIWLCGHYYTSSTKGIQYAYTRLYPPTKYKHFGTLMVILRMKYPNLFNKYKQYQKILGIS